MSQMPRKPRTTRKPKSTGHYQSTGPDCTDVTVYQSGGQAVVREQRTLELKAGGNAVFLEGMPTQYSPNTLNVLEYEGVLNTGELALGPISYRAANLDKARILSGSVDQPVVVEKYLGNGHVERVTGTLKAVFGNEAAVERADTGTLFFAQVAQVELLGGIPAGLSATPSLMMTPKAKADGAYRIKILYETGGFGWSARHSAFYDEKAGKLTCFETSVAITNGSGANFKDAQLRLLAGSNYRRNRGGLEMAMMSAAPPSPKGGGMRAQAASFEAADSVQETVGDSKMYTLSDAVTICDGETQQVTLARGSEVKVKREYFLGYGWYQQVKEEDAQKQGVMIRLRLVNDKEHNLGKALPAGEVNIFQFDSSGAPQKIGTTAISHVAEGEKFKLEFGPSSEVKAVRRLVDSKDTEVPRPPKKDEGRVYPQRDANFVDEGPHMGPAVHNPRLRPPVQEEPVEPLRFTEEEREIIIYNYKAEPVEVIITENVPVNAEWTWKPEKHELVEEFAQDAPGTHTAKVAVPAKADGGKKVLRYRIKYQTNQ
jgi:hypothetical protein